MGRMNWDSRIKSRFLVSICVTFIMVTGGFIGFLVFEGFSDSGSADAVKVLYVGGTGPGNNSSIQEAITYASPGDTIRVYAGTYYENDLVIDKPISLIGNGSGNTTIDGGGSNDVIKVTSDWVNVSGFKINNSGSNLQPIRDAGIELDNVENVTINNNNCSNNNLGIYLYNSKSNNILNNSCFSNTYYGIYLIFSNSNHLKNNTLKANSELGLALFSSDSNTVENNSCDQNSKLGGWFYFSEFNKIMNSTFNFNYINGIEIDISNNNIFENNRFENNSDTGIILSDSNHNRLTKNNIKLNGYTGIYINHSDSNILTKNSCLNHAFNGILLYYSDSNKIENTIFNLNYLKDINTILSNQNIFQNNTCNPIKDCSIYLWDSFSNIVLNNTMNSLGIVVDGLEPSAYNSHTIDTTNTVNTMPVYYWKFQTSGSIPSDAGQVILANCSGILINDLELTFGSIPIVIVFSKSIAITNNTLSNNNQAMVMHTSEDNIIENNECYFNKFYGFRTIYSDRNQFVNNTCNLNDLNGFGIFSSNNNTFTNNSAISNTESGIYIHTSSGNQIISNNLSNNNGAGIIINYTSNNNKIFFNDIISNDKYGMKILDSFNNKIINNNIISNPNQAAESGVGDNQWDDGDTEGNYWSDYSGLDNGANNRIAGDGIGDTALKHLGLDNYPFMNRSGWLAPGTPRLIDPDDYNSDGEYTISWLWIRGTIRYDLEEDDNINFASPELVYTGPALSWDAKNKQNRTYYYRLKAVSVDYESVWSEIKQIIVDWPPDIPKNFNITPYPEGNALNLSWDLNLVDTKEYDLYIKNESTGIWKVLDTIVHPNNKFDHKQLQDGKEYFYKLIARDARNQESNFTEIISAIPKDSIAPEPPTNLEISEVNFDSIKLNWEANAEKDVDGYTIYIDNISNPTDPWDKVGNVTAEFTEFIVEGLEELTKYHFVIIAFDEVPNNSSYSNVVTGTTVLGPHGPQINNSMADFSINEDTIDDVSINLFRWFQDINHDTLTFRCTGQIHINITIFQNNGMVIIKPEKDWFGNETLTFYANDSMFEVYANVTISVQSVNDVPGPVEILSPLDGYKVNESVGINFQGFCDDPDLPFGDNLTYKWSSSISGELGFGQDITKKLPPGEHIITLEVSDNASESASASISISVIAQRKSSDNGDNQGLIMTSIIAIIIVIIIIISIFIILKKRKEDLPKDIGTNGIPLGIGADIADPDIVAAAAPATAPTISQVEPHIYIEPSSQSDVTSESPYEEAMMISAGQPGIVPEGGSSIEAIDWGRAYIIITKESSFALNVFERLLQRAPGQGLCFTRTHPSKLPSSTYFDGIEKIWLSKTPEDNSISPGNITKIAHVLTEFLKSHENSVILLDGVEYLINNNDFPKILKFIELIHEIIVLNNGILLIPINPLTLAKTDFELLENEITNTMKDPTFAND